MRLGRSCYSAYGQAQTYALLVVLAGHVLVTRTCKGGSLMQGLTPVPVPPPASNLSNMDPSALC
jgi:hypothetical protein